MPRRTANSSPSTKPPQAHRHLLLEGRLKALDSGRSHMLLAVGHQHRMVLLRRRPQSRRCRRSAANPRQNHALHTIRRLCAARGSRLPSQKEENGRQTAGRPFSAAFFLHAVSFSLQPLPAGHSNSGTALTMVYSALQDEFGAGTGRQVLRKHVFLSESWDVFSKRGASRVCS